MTEDDLKKARIKYDELCRTMDNVNFKNDESLLNLAFQHIIGRFDIRENGVYVYMGSYKGNDFDICGRIDRTYDNDIEADYKRYRNLETMRDEYIPVEMVFEFEKNHRIKKFRRHEVSNDFFYKYRNMYLRQLLVFGLDDSRNISNEKKKVKVKKT